MPTELHYDTVRLSASERHETNGLAKRANYLTYAKITKAMLMNAHRPLEFWELVMDAAVYICNRQPTAGNPGYLTPYEMGTQ